MLEVGKFNSLKIIRTMPHCYLDGGELGEILLADLDSQTDYQVGANIDVFVYNGNKGQFMATTQTPLAEVDDIAYLKVVSINRTGAFLDWGLQKNLLLPFGEQRYEVEVGKFYLVKVFIDEQNRIAATTKFENLLIEESYYFKAGEQVQIIIAEQTDLGFKAIVNNSHWGMLYANEVFQSLRKGQKLNAYVKQIRADKKIDLSLQTPGYDKIDGISAQILDKLKQHGGFLALSDKSSPEQIYATFGVSKKVFKQAIGALYKQKLIVLDKTSIRLV